MSRREEIEALRLRLVDKFHERVFNPEDSFTYEDFRDFSHARALSEKTLVHPKFHDEMDRIFHAFGKASADAVMSIYETCKSGGKAMSLAAPPPRHRLFN